MGRCSICWSREHNKRTCPVLTERYKKAHDRDIELGCSDTWAIQRYKERIAPKGKKKANQQCGYCSEYGHTRRTCEVLRKDKEWLVIHHNANLRVAHDYIVQSPVGLGSLFRMKKNNGYDYNTGEYKYTTHMMVLTDFGVNKQVKQDGFPIFATLKCLSTGACEQINVRHYVKNPDYEGRWNTSANLVSEVREVIPSDWVESQSITLADVASLDYFKRSGNKNDDLRDWGFRNISQCQDIMEKYKDVVGDQYRHYERAEEAAKTRSPVHNRATMFEDFKHGQ